MVLQAHLVLVPLVLVVLTVQVELYFVQVALLQSVIIHHIPQILFAKTDCLNAVICCWMIALHVSLLVLLTHHLLALLLALLLAHHHLLLLLVLLQVPQVVFVLIVQLFHLLVVLVEHFSALIHYAIFYTYIVLELEVLLYVVK